MTTRRQFCLQHHAGTIRTRPKLRAGAAAFLLTQFRACAARTARTPDAGTGDVGLAKRLQHSFQSDAG